MSAAAVAPSGSNVVTDSLAGAGGAARDELHKIAGEIAGAQVHTDDLWGVTVRLVNATDLKSADLFSRKSDPYVTFTVDDLDERKSKVVKKNLSPEWNETFTWISTKLPSKLKMQVFDWDQVGKHDSLGTKTIDLVPMTKGLPYEGDVLLEGVKTGSVHLFIECLPVPNIVGRSTHELQGVKNIDDIVSLIDLKVVGATDLDDNKSHFWKGKKDAFATVNFGLHSFKTAVVPKDNNPTWNQLCPLWITKADGNESSVLKISIFDFEKIGHAKLLGNAYLRPSSLQTNHPYDVKLPLTMEDATTDAQLGVLLKDLSVSHPAGSPAPDQDQPTSAASPENADKKLGSVHLHFTIKPREEVETEFYQHMIDDYDTDNSKTMDLHEITHMLTTIGANNITLEEIEESFKLADTGKKGGLTKEQLGALFRAPKFEQKNVLRKLFCVIIYGKNALDSLIMKGCLTGSNTNMEADDDPTVDNAGVKVMVQDRESGMVVHENIPSYIKSALVLLNRSFLGKAAHGAIKSTIKKLTLKQGVKMDDPKSKKDIPNFVKVHRLNVAEIEKPLEDYKTFNEFFYRKLKPSARLCASPDDDSLAVSPADCRMMVFQSIAESQRLWIKGKNFTLGNLFAGWDPEGKMAAKFNGGQLVIARLAPQDYHRFHWPVSGKIGKRFMIQGEYNTVSPIAVRQEVDVYIENKRCIVPIESRDFGSVVLIAVAATMVGSIQFECTCPAASCPPPASAYSPKPSCDDGKCMAGKDCRKFGGAGWFAFGGSTTLVLFQPDAIQFDADLLKNSGNQLETLVKVGSSLGRSTGKYKAK